ncbi:PAS domain S-box protein [Mucilaginibacter robiniae]|uniref:histidine kinase n=1 Tax=Mucilaginibacter robiniae TaxID=2728022 RepID=A0A7L5E228_9SPHI|nr:PAS domain S-box protein [Mucilaginibacter robiniae]QJD94396.1 PAS domain S-box protein [Mucilaginibacter robiniae]
MQALNNFTSLTTSHKEAFNNIAALAAQICQTPFAAIILPDNNELKVVSSVGYLFSDNLVGLIAERGQHALNAEPYVVTDISYDEDFKLHQLVAEHPYLCFVSCLPIQSGSGLRNGYLCVMDQNVREITSQQISGLKLLGKQLELLSQLHLPIVKSEPSSFSSAYNQISAVFHHSLDAIIILDENGVIQHWNPKAENIYGCRAEEAIGKVFYKTFLPQHHHAMWHETIARSNQERQRVTANKPIEITTLHKSGNEFEIALGVSSTIIDGKMCNIAYISDITDQKQVSSELNKQRAFYENILNKLPADIAVFSPDHKYLFVNPVAISNPEYRKYIIGKDDYQYVAYRNRDISIAHSRREKFLQAKNSGKEIRWEEGIRNPQGEVVTSLRRMFPVYNDTGELTMVIGFGVDITDRKVLEEKQTHMLKQLSAQNAQLIDFCNIVSHNLRAPLVNMSMLVEYIEKSNSEEEQKFLISKLSPVIDNLHATFNELVESIQIKQNLEIKSEKLELASYVNRTLETLQTEVDKLEATIDIDFTEAPEIYFPPKYLLSICHNLISNALKYHSPKRKPIIQLRTRRENDIITFSVKDNGLGIDIAKHKDSIFKIGKVFHRHPNAKGFGLYMTKTQIEAMGGEIWVESTPDEGACFYVAFKNQII